MIKKIWGART